MGYCPFACAGSRYRELYRDTGLGRQAWACNKVLRHGRARPRYGRLCARHGREALRHDRVSTATRSGLARDTKCRRRPATRRPCSTTRQRHGPRHGRGRPRYGRGVPRHGARSVRAGWVRVYALYTRLSFDSVNYSESLFGTLFMNTVHEVFKKIKK